MSLFAFEHVTKSYPDGRRQRNVLDDVSFEVDAGDFVGIWGMRRCGKSTLLRLAAGVELPDAGRILFEGQDLTALSSDDRAGLLRSYGIGFVFPGWRPSVVQTAIDYVATSLLADGFNLREARDVAHRQLDRVSALNYAYTLTDRLSIDEMLRVGLAQALAGEPKLLLVDEPAVVPSPIERQEIYGLITSLGRSSKQAVLIASEDLEIVRRARRQMTMDGEGTLRSMDREGELVTFPRKRSSDGQSG